MKSLYWDWLLIGLGVVLLTLLAGDPTTWGMH
jgi:hypothetical protein